MSKEINFFNLSSGTMLRACHLIFKMTWQGSYDYYPGHIVHNWGKCFRFVAVFWVLRNLSLLHWPHKLQFSQQSPQCRTWLSQSFGSNQGAFLGTSQPRTRAQQTTTINSFDLLILLSPLRVRHCGNTIQWRLKHGLGIYVLVHLPLHQKKSFSYTVNLFYIIA